MGIDNNEDKDSIFIIIFLTDIDLAGHSDWKLPDINELQSIVNYEISSVDYDVTHMMIDPIFTFTLPTGKKSDRKPHHVSAKR